MEDNSIKQSDSLCDFTNAFNNMAQINYNTMNMNGVEFFKNKSE